METISSSFFPVSTLTSRGRSAGFLTAWAKQCERCDRQCEASQNKELSTCSYGINYHRISADLLLFGFLVQQPQSSPSQRKAIKQNPGCLIRIDIFEKMLQILLAEEQTFQESKNAAFREIIEKYRESSMYKKDLLELLKPEIQKNLAFLHDYKQFVARVKQNINVVLQTRFPNETLDVQLQKAHKAEVAIYWSAALMDDKLQTAFLLTHPERLAGAVRTQFRLHGFILKHLRIYEAAFNEKGIRVTQNGYSGGLITAPQAFAIIPHTLLDNALKYSTRDCSVSIGFREEGDSIEFSVTSFGPKIEANEATRIFEMFYRGNAGVAQQEEGSGIGLYLAQFVARDLGTEIKVRQSTQKAKCGYETTFSIVLHRTG